MAKVSEKKVRIALERAKERPEIYRMRHDVYAQELGQHLIRHEHALRDPLDEFNVYITATIDGQLAGFISITPPGFNRYSIDKYVSRTILPFPVDDTLYEVRILTVTKKFRSSLIAGMLMYAAFRWMEEQGCKRVVAIGRIEVLGMYLKLGLKPLNHRIQSGAVTFEVLTGFIHELRAVAEGRHDLLNKLRDKIEWDLDIPFLKPVPCFHGGAFFDAIGTDFKELEKQTSIINADVLDAWFPPSQKVLDTLTEHMHWLIRTSPPTASEGMREAIARARKVEVENILPGAGSSDLIYLAFRQWLNSDSRVLILDPTYGEYVHILAQVIGCRVDRLVLKRANQYAVDLAELASQIRKGYDLVVLVNPNSPTGRHIRRIDLENVLAAVPKKTRVWVDKTYVDYAGADESLEKFASASDNVIVCKSMSKVYALSGARAAYLCAHKFQLSDLISITPPWALSLPAQVAAVIALEDKPYYLMRYRETHRLREKLIENLRSIGVEEIVPSTLNFIMLHLRLDHPTAKDVVSECRKSGVFLRDVSTMGSELGSRALRIAVKDEESNATIVRTLGKVLPRSLDDYRAGCA